MQQNNVKYYDEERDISVRGTLRDMAIGDVVVFPLSRMSVIRATAYSYGLESGRNYCTKSNRKDRTFKVKRTY